MARKNHGIPYVRLDHDGAAKLVVAAPSWQTWCAPALLDAYRTRRENSRRVVVDLDAEIDGLDEDPSGTGEMVALQGIEPWFDG